MGDHALQQDPVGAGRSDRLNIDDLPEPRIAGSRWPQWLIWVVPLLALGATMFYAYHIAADYGKEIDVMIDDANAVESDKTLVRCHGVQIGKVVGVTLANGRDAAKVRLRLRRDSEAFAHEGTRIWLVQAQLGSGGLIGFNTILRGPYFEAIAGDGQVVKELTALPRPPETSIDGFHVQLQSDTRAHLGGDVSRVCCRSRRALHAQPQFSTCGGRREHRASLFETRPQEFRLLGSIARGDQGRPARWGGSKARLTEIPPRRRNRFCYTRQSAGRTGI